ncbi:MAG: YqaJ viral recombinase family protein [Bacteroidales bacterium]|jgi:putative phage-type endonuclease|nr:YqaJ viral recombinase family protein [Bacteroidales bacterium]
MSAILLKNKDRHQWLKEREKGIGSSDVASILGLNPYQSAYQLWRKKKGIDLPQENNFLMKAGNYLEDAVSRFFADETGLDIIKSSAENILYVDNEKDYLRVSPDRLFWLPDMPRNKSNKGILEIKTTQMSVDKDNLPPYWFCQLQYQLGVVGLYQGALAWLCCGRDFDYMNIHFVEDFYDYMIEQVDKFWIDNIIGNQEPALSSIDDVMMKYPKHIQGKIIETKNEEVLKYYDELNRLKDEISELGSKKTEIEDAMKFIIGDGEALSYCGQILATWKASKDGEKFNVKKFEKEHPELYLKYLDNKNGSRRFLLK